MGFAAIFRGRKLKELGPQQIYAKGLLTESADLKIAEQLRVRCFQERRTTFYGATRASPFTVFEVTVVKK